MCINCTFTTEKLHALLFATSKCEQTAPLFNRFNNRAKYISSMRFALGRDLGTNNSFKNGGWQNAKEFLYAIIGVTLVFDVLNCSFSYVSHLLLFN